MHRFPTLAHLAATTLLTLLLPASAVAETQNPASPSAFSQILEHYEAVRLELLTDTLEKTSDHGEAIRSLVQGLDADWSAERAGAVAEKADEARALLPDLSAAALRLVEAKDLETARSALYSLSKPLVRFRSMATGDLPIVAYCSMAKRSWLQPEGEIGNPYYGPAMATCGEVVDS